MIDRGDGFYECVPEGHSKASAIDIILKEYGLKLTDAYVFGDSTNDSGYVSSMCLMPLLWDIIAGSWNLTPAFLQRQ